MSTCLIKLTSDSWDWAYQTLISSWHGPYNEHYPAERNPPGLHNTSVSAAIMPRYYGNWKNKASGDFFLQ